MFIDEVYDAVKIRGLHEFIKAEGRDSGNYYHVVTNTKGVREAFSSLSQAEKNFRPIPGGIDGNWLGLFYQKPKLHNEVVTFYIYVEIRDPKYKYIINDLEALAKKASINARYDRLFDDDDIVIRVDKIKDKQLMLRAVDLLRDINDFLHRIPKVGSIAKPTDIEHKTFRGRRRRSVAEAIIGGF